MKKKRILLAVLNWGLGHAARSVPIVRELLRQQAEVIIGSDNESLQFLKSYFPELEFVVLPSYNVRYKYSNMFLNIAPQLPSLIKVLTKERRFLSDIIKNKKIDAVISDNRYGLFSEKVPTVFITHQLNIKIPNFAVSYFVNRLNRQYLSKFDKIWVPDFQEEPNLSGVLGHKGFEEKTVYIGPLSRLNPEIPADYSYDIVAILSGPEPQRSYFEEKISRQLAEMSELKSLIIRGCLNGKEKKSIASLSFKSFADENELTSLLKGASLVISRSGYSSIMDMAKISVKKILFVPTPGQTEQEYLAEKLSKAGAVIYQNQHHLDIKKAWKDRLKLKGLSIDYHPELLSLAVSEFLNFAENHQK